MQPQPPWFVFVPSSECGSWHTSDASALCNPDITFYNPIFSNNGTWAASTSGPSSAQGNHWLFSFEDFSSLLWSGVAVHEVTQSPVQLILGFNYKLLLWKASDKPENCSPAPAGELLVHLGIQDPLSVAELDPNVNLCGQRLVLVFPPVVLWLPSLALQFDPLSFSLVAQPNSCLRQSLLAAGSPRRFLLHQSPTFCRGCRRNKARQESGAV